MNLIIYSVFSLVPQKLLQNISMKAPLSKAVKVISVNILYFDLGHGKDNHRSSKH